jgi:Mlc titration factor MtfA (ptsG expression regulator)
VIRAYAAKSPAEYFAVTSELFFTRPVELRDAHCRGCTERLADFYHQDPALPRVTAHPGPVGRPLPLPLREGKGV